MQLSAVFKVTTDTLIVRHIHILIGETLIRDRLHGYFADQLLNGIAPGNG